MAARTIKLTYFGLAARGFPIRVALRAAGVAFEDERITGAELAARRGGAGKFSDEIPLGQLPVCYIDGRAFVESVQVARWAARQAPAGAPQLYPADAMQQLVVDEVVATLDEAWQKMPNPRSHPDAEQLKVARLVWAPVVAPRFFLHIERRIRENGGEGPFVLGAQVSLADLWITAFLLQTHNYDHVDPAFVDAYPLVAAIPSAVRESDLYKRFGEPN